MNFDAIEGLSDEEIQQLFEQDVLDEPDTVRMGFCQCKTDLGYATFGNSYSYGTCALQILTQASCDALCRRHGFSYTHFTSPCFCTSKKSNSQWYSCRD